MENDADILAMVAASAALTISGIPFMGPIAGAKVGYIDGESTSSTRRFDQNLRSLGRWNMVVAGTSRGRC